MSILTLAQETLKILGRTKILFLLLSLIHYDVIEDAIEDTISK